MFLKEYFTWYVNCMLNIYNLVLLWIIFTKGLVYSNYCRNTVRKYYIQPRQTFIEANLRVKVNRTQIQFFFFDNRHFNFLQKSVICSNINIMLIIFTMCLLVLLYQGLQYVFPNCSKTGIGETTVWNLCGKKRKTNTLFPLFQVHTFLLMTVLRIWFHISTISPGWWISLFSSPTGRNWISISHTCPGLNADGIKIPWYHSVLTGK